MLSIVARIIAAIATLVLWIYGVGAFAGGLINDFIAMAPENRTQVVVAIGAYAFLIWCFLLVLRLLLRILNPIKDARPISRARHRPRKPVPQQAVHGRN